MKRAVVVLALCACSSGGASFAPGAADGAAGDGAHAADAGAGGSSDSAGGSSDGAPAQDGAPGSTDAPAGGADATAFEAGAGSGGDAASGSDAPAPCAAIGQACASSGDCYCGPGSGCAWDNVACSSGACAPQQPLPAKGLGCCSDCEVAYESGGSLASWLACDQACGAEACVATCVGH